MTLQNAAPQRQSGMQAAAAASGLVGGLLILATGLTFLLMPALLPVRMMGWSHMGGTPYGWWPSFMYSLAAWNLLLGGAAVLAALRLRAGSPQAATWSVLLLVVGALSFPMMGGFLLGSLAALLGGVLGLLASRPSVPSPQAPPRPGV